MKELLHLLFPECDVFIINQSEEGMHGERQRKDEEAKHKVYKEQNNETELDDVLFEVYEG